MRRICRDKARQGGKEMTAEGYVNVAGELGMTGVRGKLLCLFDVRMVSW